MNVFLSVKILTSIFFNGLYRSSASLLLYRYQRLTPLLVGRLAISATSQLFVDRLRRSLRLCHQKFEEEAICDGKRSKKLNLFDPDDLVFQHEKIKFKKGFEFVTYTKFVSELQASMYLYTKQIFYSLKLETE